MKWLLAITAFTALAGAQPTPAGPWPDSRKVELKGVIDKVGGGPGQGMSYLVVKDAKGNLQRVMLGSLRYLMEQNFKPKAGAQAEVSGFQVGDVVYARKVVLPAEKMTIELRDENGVPLWRMGRYGWNARRN